MRVTPCKARLFINDELIKLGIFMRLAKFIFVMTTFFWPSLVLACLTNLDCEMGSKCIKEQGGVYGICAGGSQPGNANDQVPVYAPMDMNDTYGNTCSSNLDCGLGSMCLKERLLTDGVCINSSDK